MRLLIVHHDFRRGGGRRVIELAPPHLVARWPQLVCAVAFAIGEPPDPAWLRALGRRLHGTPVEIVVQPAFGYLSELALEAQTARRRVMAGTVELLRETTHRGCLVWAHNHGLGRHLHPARELTSACHRGGIPPWPTITTAGARIAVPTSRPCASRASACRLPDLVPPSLSKAPRTGASQAAQAGFLRQKLRAVNLDPLLWSSRS